MRELWSADRDFGRLGNVRIVNPLLRWRRQARGLPLRTGGKVDSILSSMPPVAKLP